MNTTDIPWEWDNEEDTDDDLTVEVVITWIDEDEMESK